MGLFQTIARLFGGQNLVLETLRKYERLYEHAKHQAPHATNHHHLCTVWLSTEAAQGFNIKDPLLVRKANVTTMRFACLPSPACARALALFIVSKELPSAFAVAPELVEEYARLMKPLQKAQDDGTIRDLYKKYNQGATEAG